MDKGLTVPKWVLIVQPKIPQMPPKFRSNLSAQAQEFGIFKKRLSLAVRSPWVEDNNYVHILKCVTYQLQIRNE